MASAATGFPALVRVILLLGGFGSAPGSEATPLLRFPDLHGDQVVFSSGGDLFRASIEGGAAMRLTYHDGEEVHPRFSPDGRWIAFTAQYDGNSDVYVMNTEGGSITRLTYHPGADVVVGWHPVDGRILFRSDRRAFSRYDQLYLIARDGTDLEELPLHEASFGTYSADGQKLAYTRVRREERTWKRYQGGLAQDVWLHDFATGEDARLTRYPGTDRQPLWIGEKIYFLSDRAYRLQIFSLDPRNGHIEQLTRQESFDVSWPAASEDGRIVYEVGGDLWVLDTRSGQERRLDVTVRSDPEEARPRRKDVSAEISALQVSSSGRRVLVAARGEIFAVPAEHGPTRNLTASSGARDKDPVWSPDGRRVAFVSDAGGEYALYLKDERDGTVRQLTPDAPGYRHTLRWSPDGTRIAFADQTLSFYHVAVESGQVTKVDQSITEPVDIGADLKPIHDYQWSPDSRFLAYSRMDADLVSRVYIHSLEEGKSRCVSSDLFNDFGPVFAADGRHLFFVSNRRFDPTFCDFEWEMVYKKVAGIYALTLQAGGQPLLPPRSDEEGTPSSTATAPGEGEVGPVVIDFDGLAERIEALPVPRGNYRQLSATTDALFYLDAADGDFNRFEFRAPGARDLKAFSFADREQVTVLEGVDAYDLPAGGKKLAYRRGSRVGLADARAGAASGVDLDLSGLVMDLDPRAEWQQIFREAWRMERDFYYEPGMNGLDWDAVGEKYGALVPRASCRQDVGYLIGELIGELSTSHTYVFGGDAARSAERVNVGLLGADWEYDRVHQRYRLGKILRTPDWTLGVVPPLARPGVTANEGDYLLAVNGTPVRGTRNVYSYFTGLADQQVTVSLGPDPEGAGARDAVVFPVSSERTLRYRDWVEHNREVVREASAGRIGYLHLPDTYLGSAREFPKYFYSQTQKQGLIIDGRFNGGGLDPDIFLQRLGKQTLAYWTRRYSTLQTTPAVVTHAHLVCLTNRQAGSGGDMLPMEFQLKGLGPVIGTRTWGGLVGVSMFYSLVDGGGLTAPDYRIFTTDGRWVVENEGVPPDIEVELDPAEMARGHDAQLMKGVEVLLARIEADPHLAPTPPPFPRAAGTR